jgi:multidrug efflux pump subunit AcrA (membrane-fusion protein)
MNIKRQFETQVLSRRALHATVLAGLVYVCGGCGGQAKEKEPIVSVQTTPAQRATIAQLVSVDAVVFPLEQATVAPKITSNIKKLFVQRGTRVKKGQLLAELENADLSASAEASKGDYEIAEATYKMTVGAGLPQQLQKAELDAAAAKSAFEAQQKIYESRKQLLEQGAIPRRDVDAAEVALAQARSQNEQAQKQLADLQRIGKEELLKSAQGSKESAEGKYKGAAAQLGYSLIKSPIDGVITDRPLFEGDLATANQPMLTVMNLSRLIAKTHIPQVEAAQLRAGNPAEIKVAGLDEPMKARVTLVSPALDPGSTTIEVWVEARKPDPALRPGMTVPVSMTAKTAKDAIVVPVSAVFHSEEAGDYVLVAGSDEKAHQKKVQIGIRNGDSAQVVSGINEGDPVITSGGYAVPDGTKIKIEKPDEKGSADKGGAAEDKKGAADEGDEKSPKKDTKTGEAAKPARKGKE